MRSARSRRPRCAEKKTSLPETLMHGSARKSRNNPGKDCTFGRRTWNAADEGRTSAMLLGVLSRFISLTTFPFQMNWMRCSLHRSIVTAIAMCCHSGSRAIISNSTMLFSPFSDTTETPEFSFSQTQWHIFINIVVFESSSSSSFQVFVISCVVIVAVLFLKKSLMQVGKSPSTSSSLSLPPPSLVLLLLHWFPCVAVCI